MEYLALKWFYPEGYANWWQPLFIGALLAVTEPTNACEKTAWEVSLGPQRLDTTLTEFASGGKILVTEHGSLPGVEARAAISCDRWTAGLELATNAGDRGYSGQTSVGAPLTTKSRIEDRLVGASFYWRYTESLQFGVDVSQQHSARAIVGTNLVAGYPEAYDRLFTRVGAKWDLPSSFGRWTFGGAVSLQSEQSMDLQLPGKDATALKFDSPRQWELSIQWRRSLGKNLFIDATYRYINTEIDQSNYGVVTSSGIPVGIAYQPKMNLVDRPFLVAIGVLF